jgi:hypothetical protein
MATTGCGMGMPLSQIILNFLEQSILLQQLVKFVQHFVPF